MPDNEIDLFQWQIGKQTVFGTAVTPTAKLMGVGEGSLSSGVESSLVEEQRGALTPGYTATVDKGGAEASLSGDVNYEQIGYVLDSLFGTATPSGSSTYTRTYTGPGSKPTPSIFTLLRGTTLDTRKITGAICNEATFKFEANKRLGFDSKWLGQSVTSGALAVLTDTAVNYAHGNSAQIYIDTWAGTVGTTAITSTAFSGELGLNFNKGLKYGLGSSNPTDHKINKLAGGSNKLKLALELSTESVAWYNSIITATAAPWSAQVRIKFSYDADRSLQIDFAGFADKAPEYVTDADGVAQLEFELTPMYHATLATWVKLILSNKVATLP